jgi:hypothetical protein
MYSVIATFQQQIIGSISPSYVAEYEWLCQNVGQSNTASYQRRYRMFWVMRGVSDNFYTSYFAALSAATSQPPTLNGLCEELALSSTRKNGTQTVQFSFATKLLHMVQPQFPIYDSRVCRFYLFQQQVPTKLTPRQKMSRLIPFHNFLIAEYARVISSGQLAPAIAAFRQHFNAQKHSDEKIVDWLIWALVGLADGRALLDGLIGYV